MRARCGPDPRPGAEPAGRGPAPGLPGVRHLPGFLDAPAQAALCDAVRDILRAAPPVAPQTPWGRPMSVRMTSAGRVGWVSGRGGYRYAARNPSGLPWPPIPDALTALWARLLPAARPPDTCLVNLYGAGARMGLHQDRDEADLAQPILSVSLGDPALFRVGGTDRRSPTRSFWLNGGDVLVLEGPARLAFHGVDRIRFGVSPLLPEGGRINLTLRVAL